MKRDFRFREIPYNYTSFSDKEIILKYFDEETLNIVDSLRAQRVTGRSARLLFEIIGDYFIIDRNPYLHNDLLDIDKKRRRLKMNHQARIDIILKGAKNNPLVVKLIEKLQEVDHKFFENFEEEKALRNKTVRVLRGITSSKNIHFSAFHLVAHATDASDWRVECPFMVVYPDSVKEIREIIPAAKKLGLAVIPRGGGTGLTGGAVPVRKKTLVINTEKLNRIDGIKTITDGDREMPIVRVQSGAVTDDVIEYCAHRGYIFATDPTSAWASTIGGNIAENAGGKKCVMWGTAIDNLYSFRIVNARGDLIEVRRKAHPYKKIEEDDTVSFDIGMVVHGEFVRQNAITLSGTDIRKKGLGKDITNKALKGLPGVQKEGGDGIIVSAEFVLYRPFKFCRTVCLEFFGNNLINASRAIVDIRNAFQDNEDVYLTALEHFDDKYILAINYRNKSDRMEVPKAVLLIDIEGNDHDIVGKAAESIVETVKRYNTEAFIAEKEEQRKEFWNDRKNLGAIARHTNAFKLNEDVVIPLDRLPDFSNYIDRMNMRKELSNCIDAIDGLLARMDKIGQTATGPGPERTASFRQTLDEKKKWYAVCLENIDKLAAGITGSNLFMYNKSVFDALQSGEIKYAFDEVADYYKKFFHGYDELLAQLDEAAAKLRSRKIIVATHMHAGDGNVHVNIPVHSNDYLMLQEADATAGAIMEETVRLGGVISGEHGIGLTKLRFIDDSVLADYQEYKKTADPDDLFNPGKLSRSLPLSSIYTPSFNLLELEAFILEATDLENLSTSIASCVRCGKCKPVCNTHNPGGAMFYNPRNKILGVGLVTEAVLYDAQTSKTLSFKDFGKLKDISNHCTMCHKCKVPCPVKIDFGNTTLAMRNLLISRKMHRSPLITRFALFYLSLKGYYTNRIFKVALFKIGYRAQRLAYALMKPFKTLHIGVKSKLMAILAAPLPAAAGSTSIRERLGLTDVNMFYVFENPGLPVKKSVLYFPGCGSERMFPDISYAVIALLYNIGVRVVLPPEYLCCGYPMLANGQQDTADLKSYENRVVLHRISETVQYMDIKDIIVSCGTCFEMLEKYDMENIFSGARVCDIHEFLVDEEEYRDAAAPSGTLYYHEPCHTPLRIHGAGKVFSSLFKSDPVVIPNCCGDGGTMALSTPAISNALRERKIKNIIDCSAASAGTILTTCPSCVQGLSKIHGTLPLTGQHLAVYAAGLLLGPDWKEKFIRAVRTGEAVEKVLY